MTRILSAIVLTVIACMLCVGGAGLFWFRARASVAEARESQVDRAIELTRDQFITLESTDPIPLDVPLPTGGNVLVQQSPADLSSPVNQAAPVEVAPAPAVGGQPAQSSYELVLKAVLLAEQTHQQRIEAAMAALRTATTDEERDSARAALRTALAQVFAADMQARQEQAQKIEARLSALRGQYQAREQVKDQIIDLQLKVQEQEAAGLGFPAAAFDETPAEDTLRAREPQSGNPLPERTPTPTVNQNEPIPPEPILEAPVNADAAITPRESLPRDNDYQNLVETFGPAPEEAGAVMLKSLTGKWQMVSMYQPQSQQEVPFEEGDIYTFSEQGYSLTRKGQPAASGILELIRQGTPPRMVLRLRHEPEIVDGQVDAEFEIQPDGELWLSLPDPRVQSTRETAFAGQPRIIWKLRRIDTQTEQGDPQPDADSGTR